MRKIVLALWFLTPTWGWSFDLVEAMNAARQHDPQWLGAQARFLQAQEKIPQARAQLLPSASLTANAMHNQQEIYFPSVNTNESGGFSTRQAAANLKIPLYQQSAWSGLTEAHQQVEQANAELISAEANLVQRVVQAYADVLSAHEVLAQSTALQSAYAFELDQANARFAHGRATIVDADQVRAKADQANADVIDAANILTVKRAALAEIIGNLEGEPQGLANDYAPEPLAPATLNEWIKIALQNNADYQAKTLAVTVAQTEIDKQRDAYLPTIELVGSYTRNGEGNSALTGQTGTVTHQKEIGVQVTMPLYNGGGTSSAVRQAVAALTQAQDQQEQVRRQLSTQITQAYLSVSNGRTAIEARKKAFHSAQTALSSAQKGLQHGMKTQLDVLNAQEQLVSAQKEYTKVQLDALNNEVKLKTIAGIAQEAYMHQYIEYFRETE